MSRRMDFFFFFFEKRQTWKFGTPINQSLAERQKILVTSKWKTTRAEIQDKISKEECIMSCYSRQNVNTCMLLGLYMYGFLIYWILFLRCPAIGLVAKL